MDHMDSFALQSMAREYLTPGYRPGSRLWLSITRSRDSTIPGSPKFFPVGRTLPAGRTGFAPQGGFSLIELLIAIAIIAVITAIAIPNYLNFRYKAQVAMAVSDMKTIEKAICNFHLAKGQLPDNLAEVGMAEIADPWGRGYRYLRLEGNTANGIQGIRRRDRQANPVNSDFDLYSEGRDGVSAASFGALEARDDVVRANDGAYFGLAGDH
jgi:general secretion pathway protein G